MPERTCLACDKPIDPSRRADAKVCVNGACRTWVQKHPNGEKRPLGLQTYVCQNPKCGKQFTRDGVRGKRPNFCGDSCWEQWRHAQRPFGEWRKASPFEPRHFMCVDCGHAGTDRGVGPVPSRCADCAVEHGRLAASQWQRDNKERANFRKEAWAKANPDKVAATLERSRPKRLAAMREYQLSNRYRVLQWKRDREARRRVRKLSQPVEMFTSLEVFDRDGWVCGICSGLVDRNISWPNSVSASLDHIIPISKGGSHTLGNVQLAHLGCNIAKGDSMPG